LSTNRYLAVYQVLFALSSPLPLQNEKSCENKPYKCWSQLKVKDNEWQGHQNTLFIMRSTPPPHTPMF